MHPADKSGLPFVAVAFQEALPATRRRGLVPAPDCPAAHQRLWGGWLGARAGCGGQRGGTLRGRRQQRAALWPSPSPSRSRSPSEPWRAPPPRRRAPPQGLREYCLSTSIHGLRYIAEDGRHWSERLLWVALCVLAVYCAAYMSKQVADRYWSSPTMTVVEATNFPIANIPFPAITLCDANRVRWSQALRYQQEHLAGAGAAAAAAFRMLLGALNVMDFGDFDQLPEEFPSDKATLAELHHLNLTAVMLAMMPSCEQFFVGRCWWRNTEFNCCAIFELQRTEAGFCFSFNSEISEIRHEELVSSHPVPRPRRTSNKGKWSGLRVAVNTSVDVPPRSLPPGLRVMVHSPYSFPADGAQVTAGQWTSVDVAAQDTYTTPRVRRLAPRHRGCLYRDEGASALGFRLYAHANCMQQCQRDRAVQLCRCAPYLYPRPENVSSCNVEDMICLRKHNDIFNYMKPPPGNPFFDNNREGMECSCLPDCDVQDFSTDVYVAPLGAGFNPASKRLKNMTSIVFLDIHFQSLFVVRYRTDLVFGWLDLIVSFGGIVGLFLGSSMLSVFEIAYHATLRPWCRRRRDDQRRGREVATSAPGAPPPPRPSPPPSPWPGPLLGVSPSGAWMR